jgi:hypothetical protein
MVLNLWVRPETVIALAFSQIILQFGKPCRDKDSSLFVRNVSDEGEKFYNVDLRPVPPGRRTGKHIAIIGSGDFFTDFKQLLKTKVVIKKYEIW